jgi:group I intron endonuclease
MKEVICGEELVHIMNSVYDELTAYEYLDRPGYCGFFINDECLYVFGGTSMLNRLRQELGHCKEQKVDRSMRYVLLGRHLQKAEWRVLEFTDHSIEKRNYWIAYYNNPIFNVGSQKDVYHAVQVDQFEQFVSGELTMTDLKALINNPELNRLIWTPDTELQTIRKKGLIQGVYMIRNKNDDTKYIGSSADVEERWRQHIRLLKKGTHHSHKLQRAYNAVKDINAFEFSLIENVSAKTRLYDREQYWIDYYNTSKTGYNCTERADGTDKNSNNKCRIHDENESEKFKILYNTYKDSLDIQDSIVKRIFMNEAVQTTVIKINKSIEWYARNFNVDNTIMILKWDSIPETDYNDWNMTVESWKDGVRLFQSFVSYVL